MTRPLTRLITLGAVIAVAALSMSVATTQSLAPAALEEFQRFTTDLLAAARQAIADGQSAEEAAASIDLSGRYPDYAANRVPAAIQAIYEELGR